MSFSINERSYEKAFEDEVVRIFKSMGYDIIDGEKDKRWMRMPHPVKADVLSRCLPRLSVNAAPYGMLPEDAFDLAASKVLCFNDAPFTKDYVYKNMLFTKWLRSGVPVKCSDGKVKYVRLMDDHIPERNSFVCVRQWAYYENSRRIPDLVIFLNGLPVAVIELKSPTRDGAGTRNAYNQLKFYMKEIPTLFAYNCICAVSDGHESLAGTITSEYERFFKWKETAGIGLLKGAHKSGAEAFFRGIFEKERLVDIIKNFIFYQEGGSRPQKTLARYYQYECAKKALAATKDAFKRGRGEAGVVYGTHGSGNLVSMLLYARQLAQSCELKSPTIVVVCGEDERRNYLFSQFAKCRHFLERRITFEKKRDFLSKKLNEADNVIFTTLNVLADKSKHSSLTTRSDVVAIVDDVCRRKKIWNFKSVKQVLHDALPKASYIGFTGTPYDEESGDFGPLIYGYGMLQAIEDGATCETFYECRAAKAVPDSAALKRVDSVYKELKSGIWFNSEIIKEIQKSFARLESVLKSDASVGYAASDIVRHYEKHLKYNPAGKAMVLVQSRQIAGKLYRKITELRPLWGAEHKIELLMSQKRDDDKVLSSLTCKDAEELKVRLEKFKDAKSGLKIAILERLPLSRVDIPALSVLYVYKQLSAHELMEACGQVNCVCRGKTEGLVVDYIGLIPELQKLSLQQDGKEDGDLSKFREHLAECEKILSRADTDYMWDLNTFIYNPDSYNAVRKAAECFLEPQNGPSYEDFCKNAKLMIDEFPNKWLERDEHYKHKFFEAVHAFLLKGRREIVEKRVGLLMDRCIEERSGAFAPHHDLPLVKFTLLERAFYWHMTKKCQEPCAEKSCAVSASLIGRIAAFFKAPGTKERPKVRKQDVLKGEGFSYMFESYADEFNDNVRENEELAKKLAKLV